MLSLRSIVFAAAAFATIASAIPTGLIPNSGTTSGSIVGGGSGPASPVDAILGGASNGGSLPGVPAKRESSSSVGDYFQNCHDQISSIVVEIKTACGNHNVDHGTVIKLLYEIVAAVADLLKDLQAIVKADLTIKGVPCTLKELAVVVCSVFTLLIDILYTVLSDLGFTDGDLWNVVAEIIALLCSILSIVLGLVGGLEPEIVIIIKAYVDQCNFIRMDSFLEIIKL